MAISIVQNNVKTLGDLYNAINNVHNDLPNDLKNNKFMHLSLISRTRDGILKASSCTIIGYYKTDDCVRLEYGGNKESNIVPLYLTANAYKEFYSQWLWKKTRNRAAHYFPKFDEMRVQIYNDKSSLCIIQGERYGNLALVSENELKNEQEFLKKFPCYDVKK